MKSETGALAPIAIFAFNRPHHLRATLEALNANPDFIESPIYFFCDGPRNSAERAVVMKTREVASALLPKHTQFTFRDHNIGLRKSIFQGVSDVISRHDKIIVVEDDLVVSPQFIRYMNSGLERYRLNERVMQISGHMFPVDMPLGNSPIFLPFTSTWGWATWSRAWARFDVTGRFYERLRANPQLQSRFNLNGAYPYYAMLNKQRRGKIDSWGILWYLSVFAADGLVLYPRQTLVSNKGFDATGTHCSADEKLSGQKIGWIDVSEISFPEIIREDADTFELLRKEFRQHYSVRARLMRRAYGVMPKWIKFIYGLW
jgi:hypothetical protein